MAEQTPPKGKPVTIVSKPGGNVRMLYNETYHEQLGRVVDLRRASHVEVKETCRWTQLAFWRLWHRWRIRHIPLGKWYADMSPVNGPVLGPFDSRSQALENEEIWLRIHRLTSG